MNLSAVRSFVPISLGMILVLSACIGPAATPVPPTPTPTQEPSRTPTPTPVPPTATPVPCPTDPAQWTLTSMGPRSIDKIAPACVYDGLAKSVAFQILTGSMGWTTDEALALLKLPRIPVEYHQRVTALANAEFGPYTTDLTADVVLTDGASWGFTKDMQPAYAYALYGCYKPEPGWGTDYPVVCNVVFDDFEDGYYAQTGPYRTGSWFDDATKAERLKRFHVLFGYNAKDALWIYLGDELISPKQMATIDNPRGDLIYFASAHGLPVWDGAWVEQTWGATMKPLPPDWNKLISAQDEKAFEEHFDELYAAFKVRPTPTGAPK